MKFLLRMIPGIVLWTAFALLSVGCATVDGVVQKTLNDSQPKTFTGAAHITHKDPWTSFSVDMTGIAFDPATGRWSWTGFNFTGDYRFGSDRLVVAPDAGSVSTLVNANPK